MEYTSLIFPGDKIDIFASGLSDNSTSYKSSFSDKLTDSMWEITMPVDSGRVVLMNELGSPRITSPVLVRPSSLNTPPSTLTVSPCPPP
ncbi:MAG: flagellar brake domain-containing protein, partial [Agathobacter rectalis]